MIHCFLLIHSGAVFPEIFNNISYRIKKSRHILRRDKPRYHPNSGIYLDKISYLLISCTFLTLMQWLHLAWFHKKLLCWNSCTDFIRCSQPTTPILWINWNIHYLHIFFADNHIEIILAHFYFKHKFFKILFPVSLMLRTRHLLFIVNYFKTW